MRFASPCKLSLLLIVCLSAAHPVWAQDRGSIEGFGGWSLAQFTSTGHSTLSSLNLGGKATVNLTPGIQAVGEFGRMANVLPPLVNAAISFTPYDVSVSAVYGAGGVRVLAAPRSRVTPYGEATAGIASLRIGIPNASPTARALANLALGLGGRTTMAGLGGGVLVRTGPLVLDLGYRYQQLFPNSVIESALGAGQSLRSSSIQAGVGIRF